MSTSEPGTRSWAWTVEATRAGNEKHVTKQGTNERQKP